MAGSNSLETQGLVEYTGALELLKMGESVLQYKSNFTQRLERELGQMRLVHSSGVTVVRLGGAGAMSQSDFFRK